MSEGKCQPDVTAETECGVFDEGMMRRGGQGNGKQKDILIPGCGSGQSEC